MPPCSPCYRMWWIGRGALCRKQSFRPTGLIRFCRFFSGSTRRLHSGITLEDFNYEPQKGTTMEPIGKGAPKPQHRKSQTRNPPGALSGFDRCSTLVLSETPISLKLRNIPKNHVRDPSILSVILLNCKGCQNPLNPKLYRSPIDPRSQY